MYCCKLCDKEYEKRHSYIAHCRVHKIKKLNIPKKKKRRLRCDFEVVNGLTIEIYRCKHCNKVFENGRILGGHLTNCKLNPKHDEILKNMAKSNAERNFKWSDDDKKRISETRLKFLMENPDKVPYLLNHSSEMSYPEKIFKNALEILNISGWSYNYRHGIYSYDFAFPDMKIDVEIDGGTHLSEKVLKIDKRRDEYSVSNGWIVIRFTAKEVKENVIHCINILKTHFI